MRKIKAQLKYLVITNSFFIFAMNLFGPLYALFVEKITPKIYHVGGVWSFYIFSAGILVFLISRYENRVKYADYFLIAGFLCRAVGWTGYIFANNIWHLYGIQLILALGFSLGTPSYNFLYSRNLDKGQFASEWGMNISIACFIMGAAAFAGGVIVQFFGFTPLFIIMIILSFISMALGLKYRRALGAENLDKLVNDLK